MGDKDYFSNPKQTTDGTRLDNVDEDTFAFTVNSDSETSIVGRIFLEVDNVNDPPSITGPEVLKFGVSYSSGENFVSLGKEIVVTDPDRGVGFRLHSQNLCKTQETSDNRHDSYTLKL